MNEIHVNRAGESLGQFSLQEVMAGLASGKFLPTDLAWRPGMETWVPLNKFPDLDARAESAKAADGSLASQVPGTLDTAERSGPAWEHRAEVGMLNALAGTIKSVLMNPGETFTTMKREGGLGGPLLFYAILGILTGLVAVAYQAIIEVGMGAAGADQQLADNPAAAMLGTGMGIGVAVFIVPIFVLIGIFVASGINHLLLMLVGAQPRDFETTFRVCAYGYGATCILQLIPVCGSIIGGIWGLVVVIIGFAKAHETTTGKAALAVLLPAILCVGLVIVGLFAAMAIPAAAMMSNGAVGN